MWLFTLEIGSGRRTVTLPHYVNDAHTKQIIRKKKCVVIPKVRYSENEIRFVNPKIKYLGRESEGVGWGMG